MGISLFLFVILIRFANKHLGKEIEPVHVSKNVIVNYYPLFFHCIIVILLLCSAFSNNILNSEKIHALISNGIFQFYITLLILIVSVINPFLPISVENRLKLEHAIREDEKYSWLKWFLEGKNWQLVKLVICIIISWIFIDQKYLVFPDFSQGVIADIIIIIIVFYIFGCIVELIKDPELFKKQTIFRLSMLYRSIKTSFFISVISCLAIFIITTALDLKVREVINYEGIVLFCYNIVMAFNEYKIVKSTS